VADDDGEDVREWACSYCRSAPALEGEELCRACRDALYPVVLDEEDAP
jgi:hypothetical protein